MAVAVMLASCLQASIGFGMGMLAAPIVALVDPGLIPGTLIMVATLVTLMVVVREREDIDLHGTGWALVGRVPGTIAGALLLAVLPERGAGDHARRRRAGRRRADQLGWIPARATAQPGAGRGDLGCARHRDVDRRPADGAGVAAQQRRAAARHDERLLPRRLGDVDRRARGRPAPSTGHTMVMFAVLVPAAVVGYVLSRRLNRFLDPKRLRWLAIGVSALGAVVLIGRELLAI